MSKQDNLNGFSARRMFAFTVLLAFILILAFGVFAHVAVDGDIYWHTLDDHMITQRVARNFYETGFPYYNAEEAIAANTSLFWPIILSSLYVLPEWCVMPALIGLSSAFTAITISLASSVLQTAILRLTGVVFISLSPAIQFYGTSGWEHIPQMLLLTLAAVLSVRASDRRGYLTVPTSALVLTSLSFIARVDSAPTIAIYVIVWLLTEGRHRLFSTYIILFVLLFIPITYLVGMQVYYGDIWPNTYYLKIGELSERLANGINYILSVPNAGITPILLAFVAVTLPKNGIRRLLVLSALLHTAYVIYVGGDIYSDGRFFLIYFPIIAILAIERLDQLRIQFTASRGFVTPLLVTSFAIAVGQYTLDVSDHNHSDRFDLQQIKVVVSASRKVDPTEGSIGLFWLGVGYHAPRHHIVDFLGKADPIIARLPQKSAIIGHNKWDFAHSFRSKKISLVPLPHPTSYPEDFLVAELGSKLLSDGYVFIKPEVFKNPENGFGLFVLEYLAPRFGLP
ncbi:hypothetical protein [Boseongicola aestuarii]|uniref:Glycosyltransferase RgtA/B/C/D-like domain-containing protein n=1 Tax=Boseongicola aestuarii TaxID=1470561 RepID=A0A238IVY3_9RHOB|nr:hypothetical protein [Boseongicola aestuarii]SMX22055.1 hypothetical protein BOA8489_00142 [Boseongicola aestuarii]